MVVVLTAMFMVIVTVSGGVVVLVSYTRCVGESVVVWW